MNTYVNSLAVSDTTLFAGTQGQGVFLSTDNGNSWTETGPGIASVTALAVSGTNLLAGSWLDGAFLSTDNGTNWNRVDELTGSVSFGLSGTNLFAGTCDGVFLSTNNGASWVNVNSALKCAGCFAAIGTNLFFAGQSTYSGGTGGVFRSTDNGTSWTPANSGLPLNANVSALAVSASNLFAGTVGYGVFRSTDNGMSWTAVNSGLPTNVTVRDFAVSGANLFAGTQDKSVFLTTNNGVSWTAANEGLPITGAPYSSSIGSLAVSGTNLFAGGRVGGVWRRPLSEMITSIDPVAGELPNEFLLQQNYPNPFNPSTTIRYQLPKASHVTLTVYDLLGKEAATLVNGMEEPGYESVEWNAAGVASGVYFCRLQAGDFVQTRKLLVLR
jgi:hypothetical protein